ncbi:MAG: hypothetical protein ACETWK_04210, partial [Candidatus Aminicenantaceae bacterium]
WAYGEEGRMKAERAWFWGQALLRKDAQSIKSIPMLTIMTKPESSRFGSLGQSERALEPHAFSLVFNLSIRH